MYQIQFRWCSKKVQRLQERRDLNKDKKSDRVVESALNGLEVEVDFFIWRPALEGVDNYTNVCDFWDLEDLLDCHEALDIKAMIDKENNKNED